VRTCSFDSIGEVHLVSVAGVATFVSGDGVRLFYERQGNGPRVFVCGGGPANDHRYMAEDLTSLTDEFVLVGSFPATVPRVMLPPMLRALGWARTTKMLARAVWWSIAHSWRRPSDDKRRRLYAVWSTWQEGKPAVRAREVERELRLGLPLSNDNIHALQREFRTLNFIDQLSTIRCPALVLYGDRDAGAVWSARVFEAQLPDVTVVALHDIGHDPLFEAPGASADALRPFLLASAPDR
jgi:pimeloyl-ACP methyl ester carboxylesterase